MKKPMVTDFEQYKRLEKFLVANPQIPFCVDYTRSFAPLVQKIKRVVGARQTPLFIQYRMNAGFLYDHRTQTDIGAGRIIGDSCHIFDLFCFLTGSKPVSVSVETLRSDKMSLFTTDNFSTQISFEDGSVCSLMYTALGHKDLGRERMELFFDSKSIIMDDYEYVRGLGLPKSFDQALRFADKGHEALLNLFFERVREPQFNAPISLQRLQMVAQLTLLIDKLACEGGGNKEL